MWVWLFLKKICFSNDKLNFHIWIFLDNGFGGKINKIMDFILCSFFSLTHTSPSLSQARKEGILPCFSTVTLISIVSSCVCFRWLS